MMNDDGVAHAVINDAQFAFLGVYKIIHHLSFIIVVNNLYFCTLFNKTVFVIRRSASTYNGTFQFFNQRHCY